jgi:hypothetical protein
VSDRLDIVRLIDAKVTSTRRTVTRSKQLAEAARDELHIHEDWLRRHHERSEGDLKRHERRMKRRERFENNKRFAIAAALFLPRLCARLYRGVVLSFRKADDVVVAGCAWLGRSTYAAGCSLIAQLAAAGARIGSKSLALGLMLAAALWLTLFWLGKTTHALGLTLIGASSRGLSWLGPRASSSSAALIAYLSLDLSRLTATMERVGPKLGGGAKRHASQLLTRPRPKARAPERKPATDLDPSRLQQAALVRLRGEHEQLQARIHAMDRRYEQRHSNPGRADAKEWVELRKLALNAQRLFDAQERQVLGPAQEGEGALHPPHFGERHPSITHSHPLRAGHAIYEAPALMTGHRRA